MMGLPVIKTKSRIQQKCLHIAEDKSLVKYCLSAHLMLNIIGHEGFVGLSVCKVDISATRWRLFTLTGVALRLCRATEKPPSSGGNKRRATAKSLNDFT
jgi:hypothetical protein